MKQKINLLLSFLNCYLKETKCISNFLVFLFCLSKDGDALLFGTYKYCNYVAVVFDYIMYIMAIFSNTSFVCKG